MGALISNASLASGAQPLAGKTLIHTSATTIGTATLYTVTANKTFYLLAGWVQINTTQDGQNGSLDTGTEAKTLMRLGSGLTATYNIRTDKSIAITYPYPLPYAAGTTFRIVSTHANLSATAGIIGWEE